MKKARPRGPGFQSTIERVDQYFATTGAGAPQLK
jgi:hypothetical protein